MLDNNTNNTNNKITKEMIINLINTKTISDDILSMIYEILTDDIISINIKKKI